MRSVPQVSAQCPGLHSKVHIHNDAAAFTRGVYQGRDGVVQNITHIHLLEGWTMLLYFVRVKGMPCDNEGMSGWWYTYPDEISLVR